MLLRLLPYLAVLTLYSCRDEMYACQRACQPNVMVSYSRGSCLCAVAKQAALPATPEPSEIDWDNAIVVPLTPEEAKKQNSHE